MTGSVRHETEHVHISLHCLCFQT